MMSNINQSRNNEFFLATGRTTEENVINNVCGYDCWNIKRFKSRQKVSSEMAEVTLAAS